MAKKDKRKRGKSPEPEVGESLTSFSPLSKKIIAAGILAVVIGYFILTQTDPMGQNWASTLSPLVLLGGYGAIGVGIYFKDQN